MKEENERISLLQRIRERSERFDNMCEWLSAQWEDMVLYGLSSVIIVLTVLFVLIMCNACTNK